MDKSNDLLIYLLAFLCYVYDIVCDERNVSCSISSNPVIVGKSLKISCRTDNISRCVSIEQRRWMGGRPTKSLLLNGNPFDDTDQRYTEGIASCSEFYLTISNLSESDLDSEYRCAVRFKECKINITLSSGNFEYHPSEINVVRNTSRFADLLTVNINITKVYPVPKCFVQKEGEERIEIASISKKSVGHFFNVLAWINVSLHHVRCPSEVTVICYVGTSNISIPISEISNCTDFADLDSANVPFNIMCGVIVLLSVIPLLSSLIRNRRDTIRMLGDEIGKRRCWELRRPILAFTLTTVCFGIGLYTEIITVKNLVGGEIYTDDLTPLGFCISSVVLTPFTLCLISNPDTRSIRKGCILAGKRFDIKKFVFMSCKGYEEVNTNENNNSPITSDEVVLNNKTLEPGGQDLSRTQIIQKLLLEE